MHHRYDKINIPTELLRTLVVIADTGSFTRAGDALKLTQSAVSAQVKRLQQLVGAELFARSGSGLRLTGYGEIVVGYAQRILALNDQIMSLGGTTDRQPLRIGIPIGFADKMLPDIIKRLAAVAGGERVQFRCDLTNELVRNLGSGHLDVAVLLDPPPGLLPPYAEWNEQMGWVCAPDFLLSPGAALPLISWPNSLSDRTAIRACERSGIAYTITFVSPDHLARNLAMAEGLGFVAVIERFATPGMKIARERYLPPLPQISVGIHLREALDRQRVEPLLRELHSIIDPRSPRAIVASRGGAVGKKHRPHLDRVE
jgi:DNA-binding transcriptional LysR family regulator